MGGWGEGQCQVENDVNVCQCCGFETLSVFTVLCGCHRVTATIGQRQDKEHEERLAAMDELLGHDDWCVQKQK